MGLVPSVEADQEEMLDVIGKEHGYRVHHVEGGSPAALAGLTSILDYIVVANGVRVDQEDGRLVQMIGESKVCLSRAARADSERGPEQTVREGSQSRQ
jgi:hypothetical protein